MLHRQLTIDNMNVPRFLYGTAWKEDDTARLTLMALQAGFRGIDTANQRKHYHEAAVGRALAQATADGLVNRDELFLQSKFTFRSGQDHRLPYDSGAPVALQVEQSFASSLDHLQTNYLDSYVLHGPSQYEGLSSTDWEAWRAMESIHISGRVRLLGVSNVSRDQLERLWNSASVRPRFVQNRCYAVRGWDRQVREFCQSAGLFYQGFSLLTANRQVLAHPLLNDLAKRHKVPSASIIFRFAVDVGMIPITGTTNQDHMRDDQAIFDFNLTPGEIETIEQLGTNR